METAVNSGMCRCCASEGAFKDVKSTYHWMGEEEIYADMLRECFDIDLHVSEHGEDGGICEVCITQLRNAINFKKQVLHTEEQFKNHLLNKTMFRPNIVKVEVQHDEESDDNNADSGDDGFTPEYEIPIKTEVPEDPKPKKRAAKASMTTRSKKTKTDAGETSTKREPRNSRLKEDILTKKDSNIKMKPPRTVKGEHARRATVLKTILLYSNASLLKGRDHHGYGCKFCPKAFKEPKNLKSHVLEEHSNIQELEMPKSFECLIKLDITGLKCKICDTNIDQLDDFADHLKSVHNKNIPTDVNEIIPFKFDSEELHCAICKTKFLTFKSLQEHMHKHLRNYICEICDTGFITRRHLVIHKRSHGEGVCKCTYCDKIFIGEQKRRDHELRVHLGLNKKSKCHICDEKFEDYWKKMRHMVKKHGVPSMSFKCTACERTFANKSGLSRHVRNYHLMEREYTCDICNREFFTKHYLNNHMRVHTGLKKFECDICKKHYKSRNSLRQHLRSHADDRRYACVTCGVTFVQKCALRSHMKSKHTKDI